MKEFYYIKGWTQYTYNGINPSCLQGDVYDSDGLVDIIEKYIQKPVRGYNFYFWDSDYEPDYYEYKHLYLLLNFATVEDTRLHIVMKKGYAKVSMQEWLNDNFKYIKPCKNTFSITNLKEKIYNEDKPNFNDIYQKLENWYNIEKVIDQHCNYNNLISSFEIPTEFFDQPKTTSYEGIGKIIKDGAERIYKNSLNADYSEYNKWFEQEFLQKLEKEENNMDYRRKEAHILTPKIENIYINETKRTIVVKWQTEETTKVTCHESDEWDLEKGIMACITKYVLGNNYNAYSMLDKYIKSVKSSESNIIEKETVKKAKKN